MNVCHITQHIMPFICMQHCICIRNRIPHTTKYIASQAPPANHPVPVH